MRKLIWTFFFPSPKPRNSKKVCYFRSRQEFMEILSQTFFQRACTKHPQQWPHLKILEGKEREVNIAVHCKDC